MERVIAAVVTVILAVVGLVMISISTADNADMAVAAPAITPVVSCQSKVAHTQSPILMITLPPWNGPALKGFAEQVTGYEACKNKLGPDYMDVKWARYNFHPAMAKGVDCKTYPYERAVEGIKFKPYWWDGTGRNFTRKLVFVKCKRNGTWSAYRRYGLTTDTRISLHPQGGKVKFRSGLTIVVNEWRDFDSSTRVGRLAP